MTGLATPASSFSLILGFFLLPDPPAVADDARLFPGASANVVEGVPSFAGESIVSESREEGEDWICNCWECIGCC